MKILVVEHLNFISWLLALLWLMKHRTGKLYYQTVSRLANKLYLKLGPTWNRVTVAAFPDSFSDTEWLAIRMCEQTWQDAVRNSRLRILQPLYPELDFTPAIKRGLVQDYYVDKARLAAVLSLLCCETGNQVTFVPADSFTLLSFLPETRRVSIQTETNFILQSWNWLEAVGQTTWATGRLLAKTAYMLLKHGISWQEPPRNQFHGQLVVRSHGNTFISRYLALLLDGDNPLSVDKFAYLFVYTPTLQDKRTLDKLGVSWFIYSEIVAIPLFSVGKQMLRGMWAWLAVGMPSSLHYHFGKLDIIAAIILPQIWDEDMFSRMLGNCLVWGGDDSGVAHPIRTEMLHRFGGKHFSPYHHMVGFRAKSAYLHCDAYCLMGKAHLPSCQWLNLTIKHAPITGSWLSDLLYEELAKPFPQEIQAIKDNYRLIVALSGGEFDGINDVPDIIWVEKFNRTLLDYVNHNPEAFIILKIKSVEECPPDAPPSNYQFLFNHPRIQIMYQEYDTYTVIAAADVAVTTISMAGAEAYSVGIPTIYMDFSGATLTTAFSYAIHPDINRLVVKTPQQAIERLDEYLSPTYSAKNEQWQQFVSRYFYRIDGKARQRIRQVIHELMEQVASNSDSGKCHE